MVTSRRDAQGRLWPGGSRARGQWRFSLGSSGSLALPLVVQLTLDGALRAIVVPSDAPDDIAQLVDRTLVGTTRRIQANGLGFDHRRLSPGVQTHGDGSRVHVDPIVEVLCLAALALFPTRGDGGRVLQRGWQDRPTRRHAFTWPVWKQFLDRWSIDAILDNPRLAPHRFGSVPYKPATPSDTTRAYAAERLEP